jgi:hypothetical protein
MIAKAQRERDHRGAPFVGDRRHELRGVEADERVRSSTATDTWQQSVKWRASPRCCASRQRRQLRPRGYEIGPAVGATSVTRTRW